MLMITYHIQKNYSGNVLQLKLKSVNIEPIYFFFFGGEGGWGLHPNSINLDFGRNEILSFTTKGVNALFASPDIDSMVVFFLLNDEMIIVLRCWLFQNAPNSGRCLVYVGGGGFPAPSTSCQIP